MNLNRAILFARVVEAGSLTRAASESGLATSSVSRSLVRLEQDLGVRLLQRTTRKLNLTAAGRAYFDQIRGAIAVIDEASAAASEMGSEPRGLVRATAPPSLGSTLIGIIGAFLAKHPQIRIELSCSQRLVDLVDQGFDLAVRIGRPRDSSLIMRRVGRLQSGLFASRSYVRRRGQPRSPADLERHDCVMFRSQGGKVRWRLLDGKQEQVIEVSGPIAVDDIPSAHQAIVSGIGVGPISFFMSSRLPNLVRVLPRYVLADLPVSLVSPSKRLEPARVVLFRDFLAAELGNVLQR